MKYLVLGINRFGYVLARYWVRSEQGLWRARAELSNDWMVVRIDVIELEPQEKELAS